MAVKFSCLHVGVALLGKAQWWGTPLIAQHLWTGNAHSVEGRLTVCNQLVQSGEESGSALSVTASWRKEPRNCNA